MNEKKETKKFRITEITEWDINRPLVQSNADHNGEGYNACLAAARDVVDAMNEGMGGMALPFECEAESEEAALAQYADKYYSLELAIPVEAVIEHRFIVSLQVDTRVDVEVWAQDANEAGACAMVADLDGLPMDYIDAHAVNATDCISGDFTDLC